MRLKNNCSQFTFDKPINKSLPKLSRNQSKTQFQNINTNNHSILQNSKNIPINNFQPKIPKSNSQLYFQQISISVFQSLDIQQVLHKLKKQKITQQKNSIKPIQTQLREKAIILFMYCEQKYTLRKNTLILAVDLFDRYYSLKQVRSKRQYILMNFVIMYVAIKFQQIYPEEFSDFIQQNQSYYFSTQQFNQAQKLLLQTLDYNIKTVPLPNYFYLFNKQKKLNTIQDHQVVSFLIDLVLINSTINKYPHKVLALSMDYFIHKSKCNKFAWINKISNEQSRDIIQDCYKQLRFMSRICEKRWNFIYRRYYGRLKVFFL